MLNYYSIYLKIVQKFYDYTLLLFMNFLEKYFFKLNHYRLNKHIIKSRLSYFRLTIEDYF